MKIFMPVILVMVTMLILNTAHALETRWNSADYIQARLLSGTEAIGEDTEFLAAFELRLSDGWHAYWRMPGDGGLPPQFNWDASENVESVIVNWPLPQRFETYGLYSFGYKNDVLLPLNVQVNDKAKAAKLHLQADIMVCNDICVPQKIVLDFTVPAGASKDTAGKPRIEKALKDLPHKGDLIALKIESAVIGPDAVVVTAFSQAGFENTDMYIEAGDLYITAVPEITLDEKDSRKAMIRVAAPEGVENLAEYVMDKDVTLTLTNGRFAIEKTISF